MVKEVFIGRNLRGITDREDFSIDSWSDPDVGTLCSRDLERFLKRKEAVVLYLQGAASAALYKATGIHASFLYRMIREQCMHPHPNGRIYVCYGICGICGEGLEQAGGCLRPRRNVFM